MSLIWRSFHIASKQVFYILVFVAVLAILVIGSAVWLSESIENRKDEIAHWVGDKIGYPVEIGQVGLDWKGVSPQLQVNDIKVLHQNNSKTLLTLDHIYFGLDVVTSIQQQEPVLKDATLAGLTLDLLRTEQGDFQVEGLVDTGSNDINVTQWLMLLREIELQSISIHYTDLVNGDFSGLYQLENAIISHQDERWEATVSINLPKSLGHFVTAEGDMTWSEQGFDASSWQGQFNTDNVLFAPFVNQFDLKGMMVEQGYASMNVSAKGVGIEVNEASVALAVSESKLATTNEDSDGSSVSIQQFEGQFSWQKKDNSWQLSARDLQLNINGEQWPQSHFFINQNNEEIVSIESSYLRLSDLTSIALLTKYLPESLRQQKPAGDMEDIHIKYNVEQGIQDVAVTIKELIVLPWQNMPGVTGFSAIVDWRNGSGSLNIDSQDVTLYPEKWLDDAVFFDAISGLFYWQQDEAGLHWQSNALRVWNDDFNLQLDGNVKQSDGKNLVDLTLTMDDVIANRWQSYFPPDVLGQDFGDWAKDAFVAGKIVDGHITITGDPAAFPFDKQPELGQFEMMLNVEDVQLHYASGWPDLFNVTGTITGKGNELVIKSRKGVVADFNFADVTTIITKLTEDKPILKVKGLLKGTTQQALNFLKNSPLKPRFGSVTDIVTAAGNSHIQLNLMVPLADADATEATGYVSFIDSQIMLTDMPEAPFTKVNGHLQFNNSGVQAQNITAVLLGHASKIDVNPQDDMTLVNIDGDISTQSVNHLWPDLVPEYVSGQTAYQAQVAISEKQLGEFTVDVNLNSTLGGLAIDMPMPIGKTSEQLSTFTVSIQHIDEDKLMYSAVYADLVNVVISPVANDTRWRGELRFGSGQAVLPESGVIITGQLNELSIDDWLTWQQGLSPSGESVWLDNLDRISMNIDHLSGFEQQLTKVAFSAEKAAQDWRISLFSEQAKGNITWPHDLDSVVPITLDFDYIKLQLPKQDNPSEQVDFESEVEKTISLWPSITLDSKHLYVDGRLFGEVHIRAVRQDQNWILNSASLVSDVINASAKGSWRQLARGTQSQFEIDAYSSNLSGLLATFGYQQAIEASSFEANMNLSWAGNPLEYSHQKAIGQLTVDVGKGQLVDVEPGAAGRIFGLLSVAAIPRRLSLDFSDLFGKGFGFSSIKGSFGIHNGLAQTDDLMMKGDTATIEVTGSADLVEQRYNQVVKVTPNVSSTLPVAGAVAGGPVGLGVGAAILIVDKIVDKLFDKNIVNLISYSYDLTGPWDDPQMNTVKPPTQ
ncbi:MAG: TIGR02099 family protein [Methylophaga sp.]|nr:MAG: TIGR02099 family protein [Methylophaga sp.]